ALLADLAGEQQPGAAQLLCQTLNLGFEALVVRGQGQHPRERLEIAVERTSDYVAGFVCSFGSAQFDVPGADSILRYRSHRTSEDLVCKSGGFPSPGASQEVARRRRNEDRALHLGRIDVCRQIVICVDEDV